MINKLQKDASLPISTFFVYRHAGLLVFFEEWTKEVSQETELSICQPQLFSSVLLAWDSIKISFVYYSQIS